MAAEDVHARGRVARGSRYAERIAYHTPRSLDALHGPTQGVVRVGPPISTAPDPVYDLSDEAMRWHLYSAVVRDGTGQEQEQLLDRATLIALWRELNLPVACRALWEREFPELSHDASSSKII
ncbi:hypothetical protein [Myceligenerans crystallogenes]|uniref:Uncharacterized protein n=1 Tax=Myceligenerans crystallogenes TaxID=316335 RepID=A0ABN2N6R7_9MICO